MSFWKTQPVSVSTDTIKPILSAEELLNKINNELDASKIKLEYIVHKGDDINNQSEFRSNILKFINNNYVNNKNLALIYSDDLFKYYIHDSLVIQFHPKGSPEKIIGIIVGKKKKLFIQKKSNEPSDIIEVDFLCLLDKLRSMHLAPYMIGVLTKETVIQYGISTAYYTISDNIKSANFGKKQMFHKPINIKELILAKFFTGSSIENDQIKYERFFNAFSITNLKKVEYMNSIEEPSNSIIDEIHDLLFEYSKKTYDIFDYKSKETISMILKNSIFHNFLFYEDNKLCDFISIYRLDSHNKINSHFYKNGYLYLIALKESSLTHINNLMESIASYCFIYKSTKETIDIITLTDIFPIRSKADYANMKFVEGSASLNYYIFNMNVNPIDNKKNGLFTV
jgi:hypothetical protein